MGTAVEELCYGFPSEFAMFLTYARSLRFDETPDYKFLRRKFRYLFSSLRYQVGFIVNGVKILIF